MGDMEIDDTMSEPTEATPTAAGLEQGATCVNPVQVRTPATAEAPPVGDTEYPALTSSPTADCGFPE